MSNRNEGALTLEDFLVHLTNFQNENFGKMRELLNEQSKKLESIERILTHAERQLEKATFEEEEDEKTESPTREDPFQEFQMKLANHREDPVQVNGLKLATSTPIPVYKTVDANSNETSDDKTLKSAEIYCFDCKHTFVRGSGEFTRHIKETSCKPYQCFCGKLFKKKSSLNAHQSTHSTASFSCDYLNCGSVFRCIQYLNNHKRRKHTPENEDSADTAYKRIRESTPEAAQVKIEMADSEESLLNPMNLLRLQMLDHNY